MSVFHQLMNKWFGLSDEPCDTCEILREQLHKSDVERRELLQRLLDKDKVEPLITPAEEFKPVMSQFTPWRVRQQMLEAEDAKKAELMRTRAKEIADLEKELGVADASEVS
jgi:L-fucose isomerase-like protein